MYSNAKAIRLVQDIVDLLNARLGKQTAAHSLNTITQGFYVDSNNASWPYALISNATDGTAANAPVVYLEISNVDMVSKDIFGNQTYAYAPHILQLAYDPGATNAVAFADLLTVEFESIKSGVRLQVKTAITPGTAVTGANVNATVTPLFAVAADLDQLYWPTKLV